MAKNYERKKCDQCPEWASLYYGDAGQLCSYCYVYLDTQYKLKRVWLVLKRLELVGWILLAIALWNYREVIELYNYVCMSIISNFYNILETVKSWTIWKS